MSKRITRNIINTNLGGSKNNRNDEPVEPFYTHNQNDLLSDESDVFIRNQKNFHCLTDDLKTLKTDTERIVDLVIEDNEAKIDVLETRIDSDDERLIVKDTAPNKFILDLDLADLIDRLDSLEARIEELEV